MYKYVFLFIYVDVYIHIFMCRNKLILCRTRISACAILFLTSPSPSLFPSPPFPSSLMKWSEKA